jgi:ribosomal protein L7/L12
LIADNRQIEAIKRIREETGLGLAEAKQLSDQLLAAGATGGGAAVSPARDPRGRMPSTEVIRLVAQNRLLEAIKVYREQSDISLIDAKRAVDLIRKDAQFYLTQEGVERLRKILG